MEQVMAQCAVLRSICEPSKNVCPHPLIFCEWYPTQIFAQNTVAKILSTPLYRRAYDLISWFPSELENFRHVGENITQYRYIYFFCVLRGNQVYVSAQLNNFEVERNKMEFWVRDIFVNVLLREPKIQLAVPQLDK